MDLFARLAHSAISGSRSSALKTLLTLDALVLLALLIAGRPLTDSQPWIAVLLAVMLVIAILITLGAYLYFMFKDPDYLRSESFGLRKMEIERGIVGDSVGGLIDQPVRGAVDAVKPIAIEHKDST